RRRGRRAVVVDDVAAAGAGADGGVGRVVEGDLERLGGLLDGVAEDGHVDRLGRLGRIEGDGAGGGGVVGAGGGDGGERIGGHAVAGEVVHGRRAAGVTGAGDGERHGGGGRGVGLVDLVAVDRHRWHGGGRRPRGQSHDDAA